MNSCNVNLKYNSKDHYLRVVSQIDGLVSGYIENYGDDSFVPIDLLDPNTVLTEEAVQLILHRLSEVLQNTLKFAKEDTLAICEIVKKDLRSPLDDFFQSVNYANFTPEWNCPSSNNRSASPGTTKTGFSDSESEPESNTINTSLRAKMIGEAGLGNTVLDLWVKEFGEEIMRRTVFGEIPKTGSFNAQSGDTTYINSILFDMRSELVKKLSETFLPFPQYYSLGEAKNSEEMKSIIEECLNQFYQSETYTTNFNNTSREAIKLAYFLSSFDELLQLAAPYIGKTEFYKKNPEAVGKNMYVWIGPTVNHDVSWKNKEIIGIDHYTGSFIKMLCEYLPEVDSSGADKTEKISFAGFNNAMSTVQNWIWMSEETIENRDEHKRASEEFLKKDKCDWGLIIDLYLESKRKGGEDSDNILDNKLRGIRKYIFGTTDPSSEGKYKSIPEQFKKDFVQQVRNTVKVNYMVYRMHQNKEGKFELTGTPLREYYYNTQVVTIRNRIAARVYFYKNQGKAEFNEICKDYGIEIDTTNQSNISIKFKKIKDGDDGYLAVNLKWNGRQYILSNSDEKSDFVVWEREIKDSNGEVTNYRTIQNGVSFGNAINTWYEDIFKDLILRLGLVDNLDNSADILAEMLTLDKHTNGSKIAKTFFAPLMLTLAASSNNTNFTKRKNDPSGWYQFWRYNTDLKTAAEYNAIAYGVEELNVLKDGNGNNLPGFQLGNQMEDIHYMIEDHINPEKQGLRDSRHSGYTMQSSIFRDINDLTKSGVVRRMFIRGDTQVANIVKKAAKLNVAEISNIAILKDFAQTIINPNTNIKGYKEGCIIHQAGTFADKKKHTCAEIDLNKIMIEQNGGHGKGTLYEKLKYLMFDENGNASNPDYGGDIRNHVRNQRAKKLRVQLKDIISRFNKIFGYKFDSSTDLQLYNSMLKIRTLILRAKNEDGKSMTQQDLCDFFAGRKIPATNTRSDVDHTADLNENFDYVVWGDGSLDISPTLYHAMTLYLDLPGISNNRFEARCQAAMQADIATMIKEGVTWSEVSDAGFKEISRRVLNRMGYAKYKYGEESDWFDPVNGEMKFCRVFDAAGNEISINAANVDKYLSNKTSFADSEYKVVYNPIYEGYFCCNAVIAPQMQDIMLGEVAAYDVKATVNKAKPFDFVEAFNAQDDAALDFFAQVEAEQSNTMSKRAMLLGATRYATKGKMKVAALWDIYAPTYNNSGIESDEKTADGAGYENPIHAIRENNYLGAAATGMTKKSIYGYVDPQTGILRNLKWATFSTTNTTRRNFDPFCEMNQEIMFKKMTNLQISKEDRENIDFNQIYKLNPSEGENPAYSSPLYRYDNDTDRYWKLLRFEENWDGSWQAVWQNVDKQGNSISTIEDRTDVDTTSLYTIDQSLGGAWMMYFDQGTNKLEYDDFLDSKVLAAIVDKFALDDYYIAYVVNTSAMKVGACNVNSSDSFTADNNNELTYFEMLQDYGGVQMDADHDIDLAEVTEMSQMMSSLIQRGLKNDVVDEIYLEVGQVALDSMDILLKANNTNNINDVFKEIGKALLDTFESGNKDTIGLAQAFIRRAQAIIESKSKAEIKLPLSAETITPAYLNTIAALIRKRGIKRKFSGFPGVQVPSYGIMKTYNWTAPNGEVFTGLNYQELTELIAHRYGMPLSGSYKSYFTDAMLRPDFANNKTGAILMTPESLADFKLTNHLKLGYQSLIDRFNGKWAVGAFNAPLEINGRNVVTRNNFIKYVSSAIEGAKVNEGKTLTGLSAYDSGNGFKVELYFDNGAWTKTLFFSPEDFRTFLMKGGRVRLRPTNPFIKKLKSPSEVDFEQTLILIDKATGARKLRKVLGQNDYDEIRNLLDWNAVDVYDWTIQAKNLKGANTEITLRSEDSKTGNNTIAKYTIFDFDASRASYYLAEIQKCLKKGKSISDIPYLNKKLAVIEAACHDETTPATWISPDGKLNLTKQNIPELIKVCTVKLRNLCQDISEGNMEILAQQAFREKGDNISHHILSTKFIAPQIVIGKTNAAALGLQKGDTLYKIKRQGVKFFETRLNEQMPDPDIVLAKLKEKDIENLEVTAVARLRNGKTLIISKRRKNSNALQNAQITKSRHYEVAKSGDNELVWYDGNEFCKKGTKDFRTIDSLGYDIMYVDDLSEINDLNAENQIELIQYNFNQKVNFTTKTIQKVDKDGKLIEYKFGVPTEDFKQDLNEIATYDKYVSDLVAEAAKGAKSINDVDGFNERLYNKLVRDKQKNKERYIHRLAKRKYDAFLMQLRFIGARIPTQSMQSYADVEVVSTTDSNLNECYMARNITWIAGSDYDIDKFYCMGYELSSDGHLITQSNLDKYFDPEWVLGLPNPDGIEFKNDPGTILKNRQDVYVVTSDDLKAFSSRDPEKNVEAKKNLIEKILKSGKHTIATESEVQKAREIEVLRYIMGQTKYYPVDQVQELLKYLNTHAKTKLGRKRKDAALKNKIVLKLHEICGDISTQVDAQLPISMDEPKAAADKNSRARASKYFNQDQAVMKFTLQYQNSLGRDGIGIVAVSMKAYFMALKSFNSQVQKITEDVNRLADGDTTALNSIIKAINNLTFDGRKGDWLVFGNINFRKLKQALEKTGLTGDIDLTDDQIELLKSQLKNDKEIYQNGKLNLYALVEKLHEKSNGEYFEKVGENPDGSAIYKYRVVDVAMSLSALLSAATDNAKELILDTLNATPEFIDIYSSALVEGEEFDGIAKLMTSETFNVLGRFAKSNILNPERSNNFLSSVINFVLDKGDLNGCERGMFRLFIENNYEALKKNGSIPSSYFASVEGGEAEVDSLIRQKDWDSNKASVISDITTIIKENLLTNIKNGNFAYADFILGLIAEEYKNSQSSNSNNNEGPDFDDDWDEREIEEVDERDDFEDDDDENRKSKYRIERSYIGRNNVKAKNWSNFYDYIKNTLIVKDLLVANLPSTYKSDLESLQKLIAKSEELKMQGAIGSINQGVKHTFAEEYRWVNRIQAFVNKRYHDSADGSFEPFDFIRFVDINEVEYRERQIAQYERVKSTINILRTATETKNFNAMLNFVKLNRYLIERAAVNKLSRILLDKLVDYDMDSQNGVPNRLTRSLPESIIKTTKGYARDLLISTWFSRTAHTLKGKKDGELSFVIGPKQPGNPDQNPHTIDFGNPNMCTEENVATFLEWMDFYVIPNLRNIALQDESPNKFLTNLRLDVRKNPLTGKVESKTVLAMEVNNLQDINDSRRYDAIVTAFKDIATKKIKDFAAEGFSLASTECNMTIGDAFFLYNLFINKDGFGKNSWTRIFEDLITANMGFALIDSYYDYLYNLDSNKINWITKDEKEGEKIIKEVLPYDINTLRRRIALMNPEEAYKVGVTIRDSSSHKEVWCSNNDIGAVPVIDNYHPFGFGGQLPRPEIKEDDGVVIHGTNSRPITRVIDKIVQRINATKDAHKLSVVYDDLPGDVSGHYSEGVIHLNRMLSDKSTTNTFIHELAHFMAAWMRGDNTLNKQYWTVIDRIIELANNRIDGETNLIQSVWDKINKEFYGDNKSGEVGIMNTAIAEEVFARLLESKIANPKLETAFDTLSSKVLDEENLINVISDLLGLNKNLEITPKEIGLEKLISSPLEVILNLFNSAIIDYQQANDLDVETAKSGQKIKRLRQILKEILAKQADQSSDEWVITEFNC